MPVQYVIFGTLGTPHRGRRGVITRRVIPQAATIGAFLRFQAATTGVIAKELITQAALIGTFWRLVGCQGG